MARQIADVVAASSVSTDTVKGKGKKRVSDFGVGGESKRLRMEGVKNGVNGGWKVLSRDGTDMLEESRSREDSAGGEHHAEASVSGTQGEEQPFRLMDLPPEIRLEIYRACLTRPFDILLAKKPAPTREMGELEYHPDDDSDDHEHAMVIDPSTPSNTPVPTGPATSNGAPYWTGYPRPSVLVPAPSSSPNPNASSRTTRSQTAAAAATATTSIVRSNPTARPRRPPPAPEPTPRTPRPQDSDPLIVPLLRVSKLVYKEARNVMYGENCFELDLDTAQPTLSALHQRSRGQIKNLRLTIPTHNEILERFAEVVRLSLRYCWRLQRFHIHMPFVLPGADGSGTSGNTTVYANAFDILRWLPRQCEVVLEGNVCDEIRSVVDRNANVAKSLDELAYARRQLISNEGDRLPISDPPVP